MYTNESLNKDVSINKDKTRLVQNLQCIIKTIPGAAKYMISFNSLE